jgi:hypothetical protein
MSGMTGDLQTSAPALSAATTTVTAAQVVGTTTNDNAAAGRIGEFITATVATPGGALTTATPANVTSIALTAGDWDVWSVLDFLYTGATLTDIRGGPSPTTATLPTQAGGSGFGTDGLAIDPSNFTTITDTQTLDSGPIRVSLASPATAFLVAQATFSVGTVSAFGTISARRAR